jgi:hypothetical protein
VTDRRIRQPSGDLTLSGHGGTLNVLGAQGHSGYLRFPDNGGLRTANHHVAAVIAGLGDQAVPQK